MKKTNQLRSFLILALTFGSIGYSYAQQLPLFTQYRENHGLINPATVNSDYFTYYYNLSFGASYRTQWANFADGPKTQSVRGEYIYDTGGTFNLLSGGYIVRDWTDPIGFTGIYGRVASIMTDDLEWGGLSLGLTGGLVQYRVKTTNLNPKDPGDVLTMNDQTKLYPDFGVGVYYYNRIESGFFKGDNIYAGISIPQVMGLELEFKDETGDILTKRIQHLYALVGWYKYINDESFVEASVWGKYVPNTPWQFDANIRFQMSNIFWIGTGVSNASTLHLEAGFLIGENVGFDNNVKVGYGYGYNFTTFGPTFGHSHEINISYMIDTNGGY